MSSSTDARVAQTGQADLAAVGSAQVKDPSPPWTVKEPCICPYCGRFLPEEFMKRPDKRTRGEYECCKCGYRWDSQNSRPNRCPRCGTYHWDEPLARYRCLQCGHVWTSRKKAIPGRCPKCRTTRWQVMAPVDEPSDVRPAVKQRTDKEYQRILEEACIRCAGGESMYQVALTLDLPIFILLQLLQARKITVVI